MAKDKRSFQKISIIKLIFKVTIWITKRLLHYWATRHSLLEPIVHDTKLSNWYIGTYICNWRHKNTLLHPCFTEHPGISEWGIRVNPKFALGFESFFSVIFHPWSVVKVSTVSRYVSGCLFIPEIYKKHLLNNNWSDQPPTARTVWPILTRACPNLGWFISWTRLQCLLFRSPSSADLRLWPLSVFAPPDQQFKIICKI